MILTVNLNPNIDRYIKLGEFHYGGLNRVLESREDATSKGVNIAGVLKNLGQESVCSGFMYENNGRLVIDRLQRDGIGHDYVWQPGNVRTNMKVYDCATGKLTEINEKGVPVKEEYIRLLKDTVSEYAMRQNIMVFTGSMPPDCPPGLFGELIGMANEKGVTTVLDAEGEVLKQGIQNKPHIVKINKLELESFAGRKIGGDDEILAEGLKILQNGVKLLLVSLGTEGSILFTGSEVLKAHGLNVKAVSPTGAGDSMAAALIKGTLEDAQPKEILRSAAAASTGTALCEGTGLVTAELYKSLYYRVEIEEIKIP